MFYNEPSFVYIWNETAIMVVLDSSVHFVFGACKWLSSVSLGFACYACNGLVSQRKKRWADKGLSNFLQESHLDHLLGRHVQVGHLGPGILFHPQEQDQQ
jgi:hypothetical protein